MNNVVDSSGWLEYFTDGPHADDFFEPLNDTTNLIVPTICIYEVYKVVIRESNEDKALHAIAVMKQGNVVDLTYEIAIQAAKVSYEVKIPMADSIVLTTARMYDAILWTQDDDFKKFSEVKYFPKKY